MQENALNFDIICGVPYGAFAVATALSLESEKPMVFKRKEAKDYGCKKMVEGNYKDGDKVLLIEDVVVYGTSIIETAECLRDYKLDVKDSVRIFGLKLFLKFYLVIRIRIFNSFNTSFELNCKQNKNFFQLYLTVKDFY